ncbi:hypothetical protein HDU91_000754, partial [Kappamyces sp. JEL0680]
EIEKLKQSQPLASGAPKLEHLNKSRPKGPGRKTASSTANADTEMPSVPAAAADGGAPNDEESRDTSPDQLMPARTSSVRKSIAQMGGVNLGLFAGFDPSKAKAKLASVGARPRAATTLTRAPVLTSQEAAGSPIDKSALKAASTASPSFPVVDWQEMYEWMKPLLDPSDGELLHGDSADSFLASLRDGVLLCKTMNALRPQEAPLKAKPGKLQFLHRENLDLFLGACEKLGIDRRYLATSNDVLEASELGNQLLLSTLSELRRKTSA